MKVERIWIPQDLKTLETPTLVDLCAQSIDFADRHQELVVELSNRVPPSTFEVRGHVRALTVHERISAEIKDYNQASAELWFLGLARQTHTLRRDRLGRLLWDEPSVAARLEPVAVPTKKPWFKRACLHG